MITDITPTTIAFAGDWHMNQAWACVAVDYAQQQGADTVLHTGDFGYRYKDNFIAPLNAALRKRDMRLFFVDGNQDNHEYLRRLPQQPDGTRQLSSHLWYLPRGYRWAWDHVRFLAMGGAVSLDQRARMEGVSWWRQEVITTEEIALAMLDGYADVVLAHDAPAGHAIPGLRDDHGFPEDLIRASDANRALLERLRGQVRPAWWFHGHYHRRYVLNRTDQPWTTQIQGLNMDWDSLADNIVCLTLKQLYSATTSHYRSREDAGER